MNCDFRDQLSTSLIPDTILSFQGSWSFQQAQGPFILAGAPWGSSVVSYHQTAIQGDTITLPLPFFQPPAFTASNPIPVIVGFTVVGIIGSDSSNYSVSISSTADGSRQFTKSFNGAFEWLCASELFVAEDVSSLLGIPGADPGNVTVTVTNMASAPLRIAGFNVSSILGPGEGGGSPSTVSG
jgi:hypothetical protein